MSRLEFAVDAPTEVAVEVYDRSLSLVARTLSSGRIDVNPGRYSVAARLPDGQVLNTSIDVENDESTVAELREPEEARTPRPRQARFREVDPLSFKTRSRLQDEEWAVAYDAIRVPRPDDEGVLIRPPDRPQMLTFVPPQGASYFSFTVRPTAEGDSEPYVGLAHPVADALLGYLQRGLVEDAGLLVESQELSAERLLYEKQADPVAAAAGAFALLYLGALDQLHDWTENLMNRFPWLPDGAVAFAEHQAREGRHEEARQVLHEMSARGVPSLQAGLFYATERLQTYCEHWPDDHELRRTEQALRRISHLADFRAKVTTIRDPSISQLSPSNLLFGWEND